jgi:hypothetical protein
MKKLVLLSFLVCSCGSMKPDLIPLKVAPAAAPAQGECTAAPDSLYGADLASCKQDADLGYCCGYGRVFALQQGKEKIALSCGYIICRDSCKAPFEMNIAMCMPTAPEKQPGGPNDETL